MDCVIEMVITYVCPNFDIETYTYEDCRKAILRKLCKLAKANPKKHIIIDQYEPIRIVIRDYNSTKKDRIVDKIGGTISNGTVYAFGSKKVYGRRTPVEWTATNIKITEHY